MPDKTKIPVHFEVSHEIPEEFLQVAQSEAKVELQGEGKALLDSILSKREEDYLPWEEIQLPSLGLYNDGLPDGRVQVRPMGISAEKILSTQRFSAGGKAIDKMIAKCVKFPKGFQVEDLLAGDKQFLFFYIRGITFGPEYEFLYVCTNKHCKRAQTFVGDLTRVQIKRADSEAGPEPWKLNLPYLSAASDHDVWVKVRLLRVRDTQAMVQSDDEQKRDEDVDAMVDQTIVANMSRMIVSCGVDGEETDDRARIDALVERMHSKDVKTIDHFVSTLTPGVNTSVTLNCEHCGNEMGGQLPLTESFFRP